jgi:hypothetical protein
MNNELIIVKKSYNNKCIISFQRNLRIYLLKNNNNIFIDYLINNIKKHNIEHNKLIIMCLIILNQYNPARNDIRVIYGTLVQKAVIEIFNKIFYSCIDLDKNHTYGGQYKVDCKLNITKDVYRNISIKAKKNKTGNIIIINKNNNKNDHIYDLDDLITIILIFELKDIIILPHTIIPEQYIENNRANIIYKSSLFTYLYKTPQFKKYIINLNQNEKFKIFCSEILPTIKPINIYDKLYNDCNELMLNLLP